MRGRWPSWSLPGMSCASGGTRGLWCPGEQVDAVAGGQGEAGLGVLQPAVAQDGDREAAGWPGDGAQCLAAGRRAVLDGDLEDLIARERVGWLLAGGFPVWPGPGCGGLGPADLAGDGVQHARAGDPALHLLAVAGQHGQPVAAVGRDLAQRLGEGLAGEDRLRVALVGDRPGQRGQGQGPGRAAVAVWPGGDGERVGEWPHDVGGLQVAERPPGRGAVDVLPAAQQLGGVDGAVAQRPRGGGGDGHRQHHRQGEGEVAGHLHHAGQRGQRGAGRGGEHRAHGHHRVQGGLRRRRGRAGDQRSRRTPCRR